MQDNRGPELRAILVFFLVCSWIFVLLRCYCRAILIKAFGLDDGLCVLAQILFTFFCGFSLAGVAWGAGQHMANIEPQSNIPIALHWWWICEPLYVLCNMMLKLSIGIFLLRLCISPVQRTTIWFVMVTSGIVCTYFFFIFIFQCWPVSYFWQQYTGMEGSCIDGNIITASTYAYSAMSCWTDWTYCILPTFMIRNLQIPRQVKTTVCLILGISAIASAATIIRIPYINGLKPGSDFLYNATDVSIWSIVETGLALSACAAATLRPLYRKITGHSFSDHTTAHVDIGYPQNTRASVRAGYVRSDSGNNHGHRGEFGGWKGLGKNTGISTEITARADDADDVIHMSSWLEDSENVGAETDTVMNSSRTNLKANEEISTPAVDAVSGNRKTTAILS